MSRANKLFYSGLAGLVAFEILKVYFIMPMPGSQRMDSLAVAYFLHTWRWGIRAACLAAIAAGGRPAFRVRHWWAPAVLVVVAGGVVAMFNFVMTADRMFLQPRDLVLKPRAENQVDEDSVVLGVEWAGQAKAWPVRFLVYHHQVRDTVGGRPVMATYCSVCRTGRVFEPSVAGRPEQFRLVGMDHFNAMFEDATTGSWWRQATGEAVAGQLKGARLPEVPAMQVTLRKWFELHPAALVMQPDPASADNYDNAGRFERGESKGELTRTDRQSWQEKSWVVGVKAGSESRTYDWNRLVEQRIINDTIGGTPIVLALAADGRSFAAFERVPAEVDFALKDDVLSGGGNSYDLAGREVGASGRRLRAVLAYQEFWHSWRTFRPAPVQRQ